MAMLSSPVMRFVHGCEMAGRATMTTPSSTPPTTTTVTAGSPEVASTMVSSVAMNSVWCPVRNT